MWQNQIQKPVADICPAPDFEAASALFALVQHVVLWPAQTPTRDCSRDSMLGSRTGFFSPTDIRHSVPILHAHYAFSREPARRRAELASDMQP
jgi:hypothetical protein